jgi:hypothetical protein
VKAAKRAACGFGEEGVDEASRWMAMPVFFLCQLLDLGEGATYWAPHFILEPNQHRIFPSSLALPIDLLRLVAGYCQSVPDIGLQHTPSLKRLPITVRRLVMEFCFEVAPPNALWGNMVCQEGLGFGPGWVMLERDVCEELFTPWGENC